ncbi:MAG: ATP-binding protein [Ilumatobacteraceae bacterium]|nr:ATP-binding protein [Ilumatobacteraceae bacterium]
MSPDVERRQATLDRLEVLHGAIRAAVRGEPGSDPFRGLYVSRDHAAELAEAGRSAPVLDAPSVIPAPLAELARRAGIDAVEVDVLLLAAAPDLDPRYEQLYGFLHDDVTRRRLSIGLALRLTGSDVTDPVGRRRFDPEAPLRRHRLVEVDDGDRPFATRAMRVPDRVVAALLGDDAPAHPDLRVIDTVDVEGSDWVDALATSIAAGVPLVHVADRPEGTAAALAASAIVSAVGRVVVAELGRDASGHAALVAEAVREAMLADAGLVIGPAEHLVAVDARLLDRLADLHLPVVVVGRRRWDPDWARRVPLTLQAPALEEHQRAARWRRALGPSELGASELDPAAVTAAFRLGPERIDRAASAAALAARHRREPLGADDLHVGARLQNSAGLQRLAQRIEPSARWSDVVLPPMVLASLHELAARVQHRPVVLDDWGMRRGGGRGDGITALFAGPSGTGKTLCAEVVAGELGLDLHTVDLATVVDKYIGETEKNLDRIFDEAEQVNTVLFFDEADALFGKRSEVKDARDRYANVEVAYLLQRMERFDGLAVLATNLRLNMDDAFARRLDLVIDFPQPEAPERLRLWRHLIGPKVPLDHTVDLEFLADAFDLAGGNIRNVAVTAAYLAADAGRAVSMVDLVRGVAREYRKLGRLCLPHEFGPWHSALDESDRLPDEAATASLPEGEATASHVTGRAAATAPARPGNDHDDQVST